MGIQRDISTGYTSRDKKRRIIRPVVYPAEWVFNVTSPTGLMIRLFLSLHVVYPVLGIHVEIKRDVS